MQRLAAVDIRLAYHICGDATRIAHEMVDSGAAVLELDYKCDLPAVKAATQGHTTVLGVVDPSEAIARATPEAVGQAVREELEVLATGGGLITGPTARSRSRQQRDEAELESVCPWRKWLRR